MGMGAAGLALGDGGLVAVLPRRVTALAMRRAAGLVVLRGLAPAMAVLRVRVRRVVGADGGVAGAGGVSGGGVRAGMATRGAVETAKSSRASGGASMGLALAVAFALGVEVALAREGVAFALDDLELTAAVVVSALVAALRAVLGLAAALGLVD